MDRQKGHLQWFDEEKGFGAVHTSDGREAFVRYTAFGSVDPVSTQGKALEFELQLTDEGLEAINISTVILPTASIL